MISLATATYFLIVIGAIHAVGLACVFHSLLNTRSSQGAIAWSLSLVLLPYFAVPMYLVFGRSQFRGYREIKNQLLRWDTPPYRKLRDEFLRFAAPHRWNEEGAELAAWEKVYSRPFLSGNAVRLLVDGDATFDAIKEELMRAKEYILFQFFIIRDDGLGKEISGILKTKAAEGVRTYVLYDEIGCAGLSGSVIDSLREAGVQAFAFNTTRGLLNKFQLNFRNHRKIVVVDGRVGFIGGHNVGDEYLGQVERFGRWHDLHLRIEGPEAAALQKSFVEDWAWATLEVLELKWNAQKGPGDSKLLTVATGPADQLERSTMMFLQAINGAKDRIWIASPYFVPDDAILIALQLAAQRGVDVRVLLPMKPDHLMVWFASFAYVPGLLAAGARVFRFADGFLHAKAFVADDTLSMVGTPNLDNRSLRLNFEIATIIYDAALNAELSKVFESDFAKSTEETEESLAAKPVWSKAMGRLARLLAPIL